MMFWTDHDVTGWGWAAMTFSMLVFWGLLIAITVVLVRTTGRSSEHRVGARPAPEDLLAERLARGEIDEDEYRRRLTTLRDSNHRNPVPQP